MYWVGGYVLVSECYAVLIWLSGILPNFSTLPVRISVVWYVDDVMIVVSCTVMMSGCVVCVNSTCLCLLHMPLMLIYSMFLPVLFGLLLRLLWCYVYVKELFVSVGLHFDTCTLAPIFAYACIAHTCDGPCFIAGTGFVDPIFILWIRCQARLR